MISYAKIGTSAMQSRACAGVAGGTYLFALPGSPGACRDAWDGILGAAARRRHRPCNFVEIMPRLEEHPGGGGEARGLDEMLTEDGKSPIRWVTGEAGARRGRGRSGDGAACMRALPGTMRRIGHSGPRRRRESSGGNYSLRD